MSIIMKVAVLETERLLLRQWRKSDLPVFAKLNSDPDVMKYFPKPLNRDESDALAQRCKMLISKRDWGLWAAELKATGEFIGFVGLHKPKDTLPFSPCVEIAWRLHKNFWGNGYATEAAKEALKYSFETLGLNELVSFTTVLNYRSRAVMERLGLRNTHQNFNRPDLPIHHTLAEHVLYKITISDWLLK